MSSYSRASSQLNLHSCSTTWGNRCTNLFWKIICGASLACPFVSPMCYILLSILVNRAEYIIERVNKLGRKITFWLACQKQVNWENLQAINFSYWPWNRMLQYFIMKQSCPCDKEIFPLYICGKQSRLLFQTLYINQSLCVLTCVISL